MDQEPSTPSCAPALRSAEKARRPAPDWIDAQLRSLYEAVMAEPLPPELRALVERIEEDAPAAPTASGGA